MNQIGIANFAVLSTDLWLYYRNNNNNIQFIHIDRVWLNTNFSLILNLNAGTQHILLFKIYVFKIMFAFWLQQKFKYVDGRLRVCVRWAVGGKPTES